MRKLAAIVVLVSVAAACGSSQPSDPAGPKASDATGTPASPTPSTAVDPLVGEWIQDFTCKDMLGAVDPQKVDKYKVWVSEEGLSGTQQDPCAGAEWTHRRVIRFEGGHLVIFDPPNLEMGLDATYGLEGDTFTANDGNQNIPGTFRFRFEIDGDELTIQLVGRGARDPWTVSAFEAAPFVRAD